MFKRKNILLSLAVVLLVGGVGFGAYTRGVEAGRAQANDIRAEFMRSRGIAGPGGAGNVNTAFAGAPDAGGTTGARQGARQGAGGQSGSGAGGAGVFMALGGPPAAMGRVEQVNGDSLVVAARDGSQVTVKLGDGVTVLRQARADKSVLRDGMTVLVSGETGTDGAVTARSITILGGQSADLSQITSEDETAQGR